VCKIIVNICDSVKNNKGDEIVDELWLKNYLSDLESDNDIDLKWKISLCKKWLSNICKDNSN